VFAARLVTQVMVTPLDAQAAQRFLEVRGKRLPALLFGERVNRHTQRADTDHRDHAQVLAPPGLRPLVAQRFEDRLFHLQVLGLVARTELFCRVKQPIDGQRPFRIEMRRKLRQHVADRLQW
jgi:hypothetical protein